MYPVEMVFFAIVLTIVTIFICLIMVIISGGVFLCLKILGFDLDYEEKVGLK